MKRLVVAVALALSTAPALAEHRDTPFEQNELDRALPALPAGAAPHEPIPSERMPFEQSMLDRGHVGLPEPVLLASTGGTSYKSGEESESPWASDHNFISPAP
jgi:hypothetical protein